MHDAILGFCLRFNNMPSLSNQIHFPVTTVIFKPEKFFSEYPNVFNNLQQSYLHYSFSSSSFIFVCVCVCTCSYVHMCVKALSCYGTHVEIRRQYLELVFAFLPLRDPNQTEVFWFVWQVF